MRGDHVSSLDDQTVAGLLSRLPVGELEPFLGGLIPSRESLDPRLAVAVLARLPEISAGIRSEWLGAESPWLTQSLGRWILAEAWLGDRSRWAAAEALWSELIEQTSEHAAEALLGRARTRRQRGDTEGSINDLIACARRTTDFAVLSKASRLLDRLVASGARLPGRPVRVGLVSSSTLEFIPALLRLIGARDGIAVESHLSPFGAYRQELLDTRSALHAFQPEFVVIALNWRDTGLRPFANPPDAAERVCKELGELWEAAQKLGPCTILQHSFDPPRSDSAGYLSNREAGGRAAVLAEINARLFSSRAPGVLIVDCGLLAAEVGLELWSDASFWHTAKQHPAPAALPRLVDRYVRLMAARLGMSRKVLVLDLDNTLWAGVVGEDGPHGIRVGPPSAVGEAHAALQRYARELKERGVLLAVCSKNNEDDAREAFRSTLGMELKEDDFVAFVANWEEKSENLRRIAKVLNVGTDSLVFVDDNPLERAKVRQSMPEVAVVELPVDPAGFVDALHRGAYFEALSLSAEDLSRHTSYLANLERDSLKAKAGDLDDFLRRLDMRMHHGPFDEAVHDRVVQLFNKTNQFNLTTRRYGSADIATIRRDPHVWTQYFRLIDCYGDNGVIGLVVARTCSGSGGEIWEIDSLLMSCRVLGRQAELFMIATLMTAARQRGVRALRGRYLPTSKNGMVADLFPRLGFVEESRSPDGSASFLWDLDSREIPPVSFLRGVGP